MVELNLPRIPVQYGEPGPLDMGYIRMLTEFGVLGSIMVLIILFLGFVASCWKPTTILCFIALFTLVNDGPFVEGREFIFHIFTFSDPKIRVT